jgi:hypothetical protein
MLGDPGTCFSGPLGFKTHPHPVSATFALLLRVAKFGRRIDAIGPIEIMENADPRSRIRRLT